MYVRALVGVVVFALIAGLGASPASVSAGPCACNSDVNNNSVVNVIDVAIVKDCINGINCGMCVNSCDVDCDGDIDYYDAGVVTCAFGGKPNCCAEPDGACTGALNTPPCVLTTDNYCSLFTGTWHGADSICVGNEAVDIPATSTWGLVAMTLGVLIASTVVIRRRLQTANG